MPRDVCARALLRGQAAQVVAQLAGRPSEGAKQVPPNLFAPFLAPNLSTALARLQQGGRRACKPCKLRHHWDVLGRPRARTGSNA